MRYRAIANGCGRFETGSGDSGGKRYAVEGSGGPGPGSALPLWLAGGFHRHEFYTRIRVFALTPNIQDKSRMRETRSYGSVRGALGDQSPYRDRNFPTWARDATWQPAPGWYNQRVIRPPL